MFMHIIFSGDETMDKQDMELANKLNTDLTMAIESGNAMAGKLKNKNLKNYL